MSTRLEALCEQLKLMTPAIEFANLADQLAAKETSLLGYLEAALKHEIDIRVGRSRHTLTKLAGFPAIKTLDGYDFDFATGAPKQRLIELAGEQGWRVNSPRDSSKRGGSVIIDVPHAGEVVRELGARDVLVDHRPGAGIRIGPHFFNTDEEVERIVHEIRNILDTKAYEKHLAASGAKL